MSLPLFSRIPVVMPASDSENTLKRDLTRRKFMLSISSAALACSLPSLSFAHKVVGPVRPPIPMPPIHLIRHDGTKADLQSLLVGKTTALQLMFTGCSESCPLQGALFATVQQRLQKHQQSGVQLLSISIDPLGDDARAISKWLKRFNSGSNWTAAVPPPKELDKLRKALQEASGELESHTGQIFVIDKKGMLVWRTEDLPPADVLLKQLTAVARA